MSESEGDRRELVPDGRVDQRVVDRVLLEHQVMPLPGFFVQESRQVFAEHDVLKLADHYFASFLETKKINSRHKP